MTQTQNKPVFETGATSHAVNDLILFTDNTRKLAGLRDKVYKRYIQFQADLIEYNNLDNKVKAKIPIKYTLLSGFNVLYNEAAIMYMAEFKDPESHEHIKHMSKEEAAEYKELYVSDFENWKKENGF